MHTPSYLKKGDKVALIAPAAKITNEYINRAVKLLNEWGLDVVIGKNVLHADNYYAAPDTQRAEDLQQALDNPEIKAIICARGGYGTIRIMNKIVLKKFRQHPKWIVGFSDITVLHNLLQNTAKTETIHGTMPVQFEKNDKHTLDSLKNALFGEKIYYRFATNNKSLSGNTNGIITGGNLSVIYSLSGTPWDIDTKNKILFIEDIDEYLYHIDRIMMNLSSRGILNNIKGVIVGGMNMMKEGKTPYGISVEVIILEHLKPLNVPVAFGFPAGHGVKNHAFYLGRNIQLHVDKDYTEVIF